MKQNTGLPEIDDANDVNDESVELDVDVAEEFFEDKPKPMPKGMKYGLMALPIVLIAGLVVMNGLKKSGNDIQIGIDGEVIDTSYPIAQIEDFGDITTESDGKEDMQKNGADSDDKSVIGKLKLSGSPMDQMKEQIESLTSQMQEMTGAIDRLKEQGIVVNKLRTQVSGMEEQLKHVPIREELDQVKSDFSAQLEKKVEELKVNFDQLYKKAKRAVSYKKRSVVMPFRLVSIDQWDGVNYAAIQSTSVGGIENLRQGDTRSGWIVANIDSMKMTVTFEHSKSGKTVVKNTI